MPTSGQEDCPDYNAPYQLGEDANGQPAIIRDATVNFRAMLGTLCNLTLPAVLPAT